MRRDVVLRGVCCAHYPIGFVPRLSDGEAETFPNCQLAELQDSQDTATLETNRKRLLRHNWPGCGTGSILLGLHTPLELVHEILGMTTCPIATPWCLISIFGRLLHYLPYATLIETLVLLVIVYDIFWHRWNAIREIKREEEAETRQIRREQQEILRKHWQELQSNLISLNQIASHLVQIWRFVEQNRNAPNPATVHALTVVSNRLPSVLMDFGDYWGRAVAQLNVFPSPRDALTLEVLTLINDLGNTVRDSSIEIRDETLQALAELARRVSERATLPRLDA
jgi:hypothetical protein